MPDGLRILSVAPGSIAAETGVQCGEHLVGINGEAVEDSIDYLYFSDEPQLVLEFVDRNGQPYEVEIEGRDDMDLGLELAPTKVRVCTNHCPFCFVDQMPQGFRPSLYVKDDDWRTSFLHGSYVTLTNADAHDIERIKRRQVSPLYVSVHATDDSARRYLLGKPDAQPILPLLEDLAQAGIRIFAQAVIVAGANDGDVLDKTMHDLFALYPAVASLSIVPVGLTSARQGLRAIPPITPAQAGDIVDRVERAQARFLEASGSRFVFAADELYLRCGRAIPPAESYEDFTQIENGVGLVAEFLQEVDAALAESNGRIPCPGPFVWVTGTAFAPHASALCSRLERQFGLNISAFGIENRTFGPTVTVTGLLTAEDIVSGLDRNAEGAVLILPSVLLRDREGLTLDNWSAERIGTAVGACAVVCPNGGEEFVQSLFQEKEDMHV